MREREGENRRDDKRRMEGKGGKKEWKRRVDRGKKRVGEEGR